MLWNSDWCTEAQDVKPSPTHFRPVTRAMTKTQLQNVKWSKLNETLAKTSALMLGPIAHNEKLIEEISFQGLEVFCGSQGTGQLWDLLILWVQGYEYLVETALLDCCSKQIYPLAAGGAVS